MKADKDKEIGIMAGTLALTEVSLGSLIHAFHIPLGGQVLSVNQIGILARAVFKLQSKDVAISISLVSSILKSLSPAGKKLTPMLAISAQGILFSIPFYFLGINILSLFLATLLASLWAFLQPVFFLYLFFGDNLIKAAHLILKGVENYIPHFANGAWYFIAALAIIKIIAAFIYSKILINMSDEKFSQFSEKKIFKQPVRKNTVQTKPFQAAIRELFNPLFIITLVLTLAFFIFMEASFSSIIWQLLRPIAIGFSLFYFFKVVPMEKMISYLEKKNFQKIARSLQIANEYINHNSKA